MRLAKEWREMGSVVSTDIAANELEAALAKDVAEMRGYVDKIEDDDTGYSRSDPAVHVLRGQCGGLRQAADYLASADEPKEG